MTDYSNSYELKGIKYALLALFMIMALAFIVIPVSATNIDISAQIEPSFNMTIQPTVLQMPLHVGSNLILGGDNPWVMVSTNAPGWRAQVIDASQAPANGNNPNGHMTLIKPGYTGVKLVNPLEIGLDGTYTPITGTLTTFKTGGVGAYTSQLQFRQIVDVTDLATDAGSSYYFIAGITGGAI